MGKSLKNYTSKVPAIQSIAEVEKMLVKAGARTIQREYNNKGEIKGLEFLLPIQKDEPLLFRLPAKVERVHKILQDYKANTPYQQAQRTAWRNVRDWVAVQLALVETNQVQLTEVFLPYMIIPTGKTLFEHIASSGATPFLKALEDSK